MGLLWCIRLICKLTNTNTNTNTITIIHAQIYRKSHFFHLSPLLLVLSLPPFLVLRKINEIDSWFSTREEEGEEKVPVEMTRKSLRFVRSVPSLSLANNVRREELDRLAIYFSSAIRSTEENNLSAISWLVFQKRPLNWDPQPVRLTHFISTHLV